MVVDEDGGFEAPASMDDVQDKWDRLQMGKGGLRRDFAAGA